MDLGHLSFSSSSLILPLANNFCEPSLNISSYYHVHWKIQRKWWPHGERINADSETSIKNSECRSCVCLFIFSLLTWHTFIKFLLVGYSLSHLPHFYYPCTTSMHVGFIRQMSSLVWLYSLVVSCNSLQECGSSQGATYLELQVNWKTSGFIFFCLYFLFLKKGILMPPVHFKQFFL